MAVLSLQQIAEIHAASLEVLADVGVKIENEGVLRLLCDIGGKRNGRSNTIQLPPETVERSLGLCPARVRLASLSGEDFCLEAGGGSVFWTGNALSFVHKKKAVPIKTREFARFVRLCDQLEYVHGVVGPCLSDVPPPVRGLAGMRRIAENSVKHIRPCIYDPQEIKGMIEMANVILDGEALSRNPIFSLGYTAISPLRWSGLALAAFEESSGYGIPIMINSEPAGGVTSPATLAGELVMANAEALSGVVIVQALEPGRPVIFNLGFAHILDMQTTVMRTGSVENALLQAAGAEIAAYHGLPSASWMSTESPIADAQASLEKTLLATMHGMSHANVIWGVGNLDATKSLSFEQAVIDNDMAGAVLRAQKGIELTDDTLAKDFIIATGHDADYLMSEHTGRHFRDEYFFPHIAARVTRGQWKADGGSEIIRRAGQRCRGLLEKDVRCVLSAAQKRGLARIQKKWEHLLT